MHRAATLAEVQALLRADEGVSYSIDARLFDHAFTSNTPLLSRHGSTSSTNADLSSAVTDTISSLNIEEMSSSRKSSKHHFETRSANISRRSSNISSLYRRSFDGIPDTKKLGASCNDLSRIERTASPFHSTRIRTIKTEAIRAFLARRTEDASRFVMSQMADDKIRRHVFSLVDRRHLSDEKAAAHCLSSANGEDDQFRKDCADLIASIVEIYERDFVTLCHGHRGTILGDPHPSTIRFLLTGVCLSILYDAVPTKFDILEKLAHETLIIISARDIWLKALRLFGPVRIQNVTSPGRELGKRPHTIFLPSCSLSVSDPSFNAKGSLSRFIGETILSHLQLYQHISQLARRSLKPDEQGGSRGQQQSMTAKAVLNVDRYDTALEAPPEHACLMRCVQCGQQMIRYFVAFEPTSWHSPEAATPNTPRIMHSRNASV
eukprot:gene6991-9587_t